MSETGTKILRCVERDCRKDFEVTAKEAEFYEEKGFPLPKRCKECRARRKRENNSAFGDVSRQARSGGGFDFNAKKK